MNTIQELEYERLVSRLRGHYAWVLFIGATLLLVKLGIVR
jgi:hypothetical protein